MMAFHGLRIHRLSIIVSVVALTFVAFHLLAQETDTYREQMSILAGDKWLMSEFKMSKAVSFEFVDLKPGSFCMGSAPEESGRFSNEVPRLVTITQSFMIAKTDVTQLQYYLVTGLAPSHFVDETAPDFIVTSSGLKLNADRPVESVSWQDAHKFIESLNRLDTKHVYRLPTEAEWEYAARAASTTAYSFGDDERDLSAYAIFSEYFKRETAQVATKKPNPFGLFDMHGNLGQWCEDTYTSKPIGNVDPFTCEFQSVFHVVRGGSWRDESWALRSAFRGLSSTFANTIGFRLVRTLK